MSKILELANVKLGSVVSNVMGVTGPAILDAMIAGEDDPEVLRIQMPAKLSRAVRTLCPPASEAWHRHRKPPQ